MTNSFLKAKHWQLFLMIFGVPMIFQFIMMGDIVSKIGSGDSSNPEFIFHYMKFFPLVMIIFMGVFFGWFWSIVTGLQKCIPTDFQVNLNRFNIFFFIPLIYILSLTIFIGGMVSGVIDGSSTSNGMVAIILPLHLLSMFCMFHTLYFVAKTIKTAELQRKVTFSDFAGEFFMIWFYPIGIWIIQPKINQLVEDKLSSQRKFN